MHDTCTLSIPIEQFPRSRIRLRPLRNLGTSGRKVPKQALDEGELEMEGDANLRKYNFPFTGEHRLLDLQSKRTAYTLRHPRLLSHALVNRDEQQSELPG